MAPKATTQREISDDSATVIDVTEAMRHEIPSELERRVGMYWELLVEVRIEAKTPGEGWRETKSRFKLGSPPPSIDATEICLRIIDLVLTDAHANDPADSYRAKLLVRGVTGKTERRYADLAAVVDSEGDLMVIDSSVVGTRGEPEDPLMARMNEISDIGVRSLAAVVEASEGIGNMAKSAAGLLESHIKAYKHISENTRGDAEFQFRIAELDVMRDASRYDYDLRRNRQDHLGSFFTTLAGPIGEMLQSFAAEFGVDLGTVKADPAAACELAGMLRTFLDGLKPDQTAAMKALFAGDEWEIFQSGRNAESDQIFAARFSKMAGSMKERGLDQASFAQQIMKAVGLANMARLNQIWKRLGEMGV